ncbi:MAG: hypothetical protein AB7E10_10485 [Burkholderiaceae bacterium]
MGVESEKAHQRDQFLPDSPPHSGAMGQEDGKKWAAAAHSQPTIPKSDRLLGACRALGVESEKVPRRDQFLPDSPPHSGAMGQEDGKKWAAAAHSQPTIPKPDRLLGLCKHRGAGAMASPIALRLNLHRPFFPHVFLAALSLPPPRVARRVRFAGHRRLVCARHLDHARGRAGVCRT